MTKKAKEEKPKLGKMKIQTTIKGDKVSTILTMGEDTIDIDVTPDEAEDWGESLQDMANVLRKEQKRKSRRGEP
jgi:hypothetical protein